MEPKEPKAPWPCPAMGTQALASYDRIVVAFSGGKDSLACLLHLIDAGAPRERIELWHHDVDGREGSSLMDWPVTRAYCRAVAQAFGVPIFFSWKAGGFEREMCRDGNPTAPIHFETPEGLQTTGGAGPVGTRRVFPQVSADLSVRWCSAYLKIDVGAAAMRGQARFEGKRTLFVTGERAEESTARARYQRFEPHRADNRAGKRNVRHVDQWRPVHGWSEREVWACIERHRVRPHPAYVLGWGRVSCAACIFGSPDQWASLREVNPDQFARVAFFERQWGKTIHRKDSIETRAAKGRAYMNGPRQRAAALADTYDAPILVPHGERWILPSGAFGDSCGPT